MDIYNGGAVLKNLVAGDSTASQGTLCKISNINPRFWIKDQERGKRQGDYGVWCVKLKRRVITNNLL
jgi:hypothetical protein